MEDRPATTFAWRPARCPAGLQASGWRLQSLPSRLVRILRACFRIAEPLGCGPQKGGPPRELLQKSCVPLSARLHPKNYLRPRFDTRRFDRPLGGFVWSQRVLEVLAPGFRPEGVGLQFSKSGQGSFQQSALSRQSDKGENIGGAPQRARRAERRRIAVALDVGFVWRGGAVKVAAGRRPASSRRLRRALTCPTCFRIHLEAHAHAKPWAWHPADLPYLLGGGLTSS